MRTVITTRTLMCVRPGDWITLGDKRYLVTAMESEWNLVVRNRPSLLDYIRFAAKWAETWMKRWDRKFAARYWMGYD